MEDGDRALIARILLIGAAVLALIGFLCSTGTLPIAPGARYVMTLAFGIAAFADALLGVWFVSRSRG
jgi:hypothetical protein